MLKAPVRRLGDDALKLGTCSLYFFVLLHESLCISITIIISGFSREIQDSVLSSEEGKIYSAVIWEDSLS